MKSFNGNIFKTLIIVLLAEICFYKYTFSQTDSESSSDQFLYNDFRTSRIKMKKGPDRTVLLNYNVLSEKMVYKQGNDLFDLMNTDMVDTVFLGDSKFVPVGKSFYEVLLVANTPLFVQNKGKLIPPGTPAGYGGTSQTSSTSVLSSLQTSQGTYNLKLPEDYTVRKDKVYWIKKDGNLISFINERQFLKAVPEKAAELKQYSKQNNIRFDNKGVLKLVEHYNELTNK